MWEYDMKEMGGIMTFMYMTTGKMRDLCVGYVLDDGSGYTCISGESWGRVLYTIDKQSNNEVF